MSLAFVSDVLTAPLKISGQPIVESRSRRPAAPTADWVVKLIDVYPDEVAGQPAMGGYQLMVVGRHLPRPLSRELRDAEGRSRQTSRCCIASRCPPRTTCSCRATGSWCRCSRAGFRSTTATRRRSCRTSSGRSRATIGRPSQRDLSRAGPGEFRRAPDREDTLRCEPHLEDGSSRRRRCKDRTFVRPRIVVAFPQPIRPALVRRSHSPFLRFRSRSPPVTRPQAPRSVAAGVAHAQIMGIRLTPGPMT